MFTSGALAAEVSKSDPTWVVFLEIEDDGEPAHFNVGNISDLIGSMPTGTIVEAGSEIDTMTVATFAEKLRDGDADGEVELYWKISETEFAYWNVKEVRPEPNHEAIYVVAGDFMSGGM